MGLAFYEIMFYYYVLGCLCFPCKEKECRYDNLGPGLNMETIQLLKDMAYPAYKLIYSYAMQNLEQTLASYNGKMFLFRLKGKAIRFHAHFYCETLYWQATPSHFLFHYDPIVLKSENNVEHYLKCTRRVKVLEYIACDDEDECIDWTIRSWWVFTGEYRRSKKKKLLCDIIMRQFSLVCKDKALLEEKKRVLARLGSNFTFITQEICFLHNYNRVRDTCCPFVKILVSYTGETIGLVVLTVEISFYNAVCKHVLKITPDSGLFLPIDKRSIDPRWSPILQTQMANIIRKSSRLPTSRSCVR
jgi:hypothetical protein